MSSPAVLAFWFLLFVPSVGWAQDRVHRIVELQHEGMTAYHQLDLRLARERLEAARMLAREAQLDPMIARAEMCLGVVAVAGLRDNAAGLAHFEAALRSDPRATLDPLLATPDVQLVFSLARTRVRPPAAAGPVRAANEAAMSAAPVSAPPEAPRIASLGDTCGGPAVCRDGLVCHDGLCVLDSPTLDAPARPEDDASAADGPGLRFFAHVMGGLGMAYVHPGMAADRGPGAVDQADSLIPGETEECPYGSTPEGDLIHCVRLQRAGVVSQPALRLAIGFSPLPRIAITAWARISPIAGYGTMVPLLLGGRLEVELTDPSPLGVHASVFGGGGGGQIQVQPPENGDDAPFVASGLGNVSAGGYVEYRFHEHVGILAQVDVMVQVPTVLGAIDVTAGLSANL